MPDPNVNLQALLAEAAQRFNPNVPGVDFGDLLRRVMMAESGGNLNEISSTGAIGPMQLMPGTARELRVDPYNPRQNIFGGAQYLAQGIKKYGLEGGLRYYNAGTPYAHNQGYVRLVLGNNGLGALPSRSRVQAGTGAPSGGTAQSLTPSPTPVNLPDPFAKDKVSLIRMLEQGLHNNAGNPYTSVAPDLNAALNLPPGTTPLSAAAQAAQVTGPNQFDLQALQTQADQARNQAALSYLQGHPLPQATFNPITGGPTPTHEQVPIPKRQEPRTDLAGTIIGALGGLIAPQAAGYFAAAPLQAATAAADQQYRDNLLRYHLATEQANTRFSDQELAYQQALNDAVRNEAERQRVEGINQGRDITSIQAGLEPTAALAGGKTLLDPTTGLPALGEKAKESQKAASRLGVIQDYVKSAQDLQTRQDAHDIKAANALNAIFNADFNRQYRQQQLGQGERKLDIAETEAERKARQGDERNAIARIRAESTRAHDQDPVTQLYRSLRNQAMTRKLNEATLNPQQKADLDYAKRDLSGAEALFRQANIQKHMIDQAIAEGRITDEPITIGGVTKSKAAWERDKAYSDAENALNTLKGALTRYSDLASKLPTVGPGANLTLPNTTGTTNPPANPASGPKTPPAGSKAPPAGQKSSLYQGKTKDGTTFTIRKR